MLLLLILKYDVPRSMNVVLVCFCFWTFMIRMYKARVKNLDAFTYLCCSVFDRYDCVGFPEGVVASGEFYNFVPIFMFGERLHHWDVSQTPYLRACYGFAGYTKRRFGPTVLILVMVGRLCCYTFLFFLCL